MRNFILLIACLFSYTACAQTQTAPPDRSKMDTEVQALNESVAPIVEKIQLLMEEYQNTVKEKGNDEEYLASVEARYEVLQKELKKDYIAFVNNNPNSFVSLMVIQELSHQDENPNEYSALLKKLHPEIQNSEDGKALAQQLQSQSTTAIGSVAPDFIQNDPNGKPVRLSDFRGKYVLLDFWASWCGPCRRENPNIVKTYEQFNDKNFEILGISLDNPGRKQDWLNAIAKDQLTWPQVSDLKGWQNAVAVQYMITSIPQNLLLNPEGVIIAKNLRGNQLTAKLAEVLK